MKIIESKFRLLYIIKISLGYLISLLCICGLCYFYQDIYNDYTKQRSTILIILIVFLTVAGTWDFLRLTKVVVGQEKLEIQSFFIKNMSVSFNEIKSIERHKIVQWSDAGQITDGYHLSEIILSNQLSIIISPDKFENYSELISEIKNKLNSNTQ